MNVKSRIRSHFRFLIIVAVLLASIGGLASEIFWSRTSDAQQLMHALSAVAREGCPEEVLLAAVGNPDRVLSGDQIPQWLLETTGKSHSKGVLPTDEFLLYTRKHDDGLSKQVYLQVRDSHLVNVDTEFPDPDSVKVHTLQLQ
ncbi:hypothetical protein [Lacipirellula limnantheis]|nr:hypothetical protein [Lacipirellula limnantheis]